MRVNTSRHRLFRLFPAWLGLISAACTFTPDSRWPDPVPSQDAADSCRLFHKFVTTEIDRADTRDAEAVEVAGFSFLRTNRFLASFAKDDLDETATRAWVGRMQALGNEGLSVEIGNLGRDTRHRLNAIAQNVFESPAIDAIAACSQRSAQELLASQDALSLLHNAVRVPDHYDDAQRVLGVYPLTAMPVAIGYDQWRKSNLGTFGLATEALPNDGARTAYRPADGPGTLPAPDVRAILDRSKSNPLRIPTPSATDLNRLFQAFAPVWIVDANGPDDRIGKLSWRDDTALSVDTTQPTVYRKLTWTRFRGEILLQLNYLAWFPARTKSSAFDLLGGVLDGVIWRVTLGPDGRPMIYDSIHACGCYHLFFPVSPMVPKSGPPPHDIRERAETPAPGLALKAGQRIAIWLAGTSHYVQAITLAGDPNGSVSLKETYVLEPADNLRRLDRPDGQTQSIYGPDGIIAGTERLERFVLWPMGIASPGAMRQWGTHATAFVGRRHFDDAYLFDTNFRVSGHIPR